MDEIESKSKEEVQFHVGIVAPIEATFDFKKFDLNWWLDA